MTTATYTNPAAVPDVVRLRAGRLGLLLVVLLAVLGVGGYWLLSTFGKKVQTTPAESLIQPSWIKEAVAYTPEPQAAAKAAATPDRTAEIMRQLAAMQQEMQAQREALEALKKRPVVGPPSAPKPAASAPAPKPHGSMLFVSHDLKDAARGAEGQRVHVGAGRHEAALHPGDDNHFRRRGLLYVSRHHQRLRHGDRPAPARPPGLHRPRQ